MNHAAKRLEGFTLIELMLAMIFVSVLLLAIAFTIIQIGAIYTRGMTLKEVNQTSRDISDDLRRTVAGSEAFSLTTDYVTNSAGGRLCTGTYSYVWNYAKALASGDTNLTTYEANAGTVLRLVKVPDPGKLYCLKAPNGALQYRQIRLNDTSTAQELLKAGDRQLSLHQFTVTSGPGLSDPVTGQQLYSILFAIGTGRVEALNADQSACLPPGDPNSDLLYCAVQQFTLVVRAGNRVN